MRQVPLHRVGGTEGLPRMQGSNHLGRGDGIISIGESDKWNAL